MEIREGYKQTEVGVIPVEWERKPLAVISIMKGRIGWQGLKQTEFTMDIDEPFLITGMNFKDGAIRWDEVYHVSLERYEIAKEIQLKTSDVLMTKDGTIGKLLFVDEIPYPYKATLNSHLLVFRPIQNSYDSRYLYYHLSSKVFKNYIDLNKYGTTFYGISQELVGEYQVLLPPLAEQKNIATALSDIDELISSLTKLVEKKKNIKQGAMNELLKPKEDWVEKKLGDTTILKARIGWQGLTTAEYKETGEYLLITGTEFENGFINWTNCFYIDEGRYKQDKNIQVKVNDVLVTKDGTIGKVALINNLPKPATLNSGVFVIRPIDNSFEPKFFYYLLMSKIFREFLAQLSAGSTINHLYQKDFVNFQFQTPSTIEEQIRIADILSEMDAEISALEGKLTKYKAIKQGMMQELLTGRIRLVEEVMQ